MISEPGFASHQITQNDDLMFVMASDGLWDMFSSEEVYDMLDQFKKDEEEKKHENTNIAKSRERNHKCVDHCKDLLVLFQESNDAENARNPAFQSIHGTQNEEIRPNEKRRKRKR